MREGRMPAPAPNRWRSIHAIASCNYPFRPGQTSGKFPLKRGRGLAVRLPIPELQRRGNGLMAREEMYHLTRGGASEGTESGNRKRAESSPRMAGNGG